MQVKPFEVIDAVPYSVKLSWDQSNAMDTTSDTASTGDEGDAQEAAVVRMSGSVARGAPLSPWSTLMYY